tara:strand:+ start:450 stop:2021 length:1572 start_codon:yes stop_codon:yes gene_type:complete
MSDNVNVGMGIGLQGQLTAPGRIFAAQEADKQYQRKLNLAAQKEKDDEVEAIKKKIILDKPKIHRLLAYDVSTKTAEALKGMVEAKQNSPNDYLSKIYDIYGNLQGTLNDAVSKSASLKKFEDDMTLTTGKEYVSSNSTNAYNLMSKSNNLQDWYSKMQSAGVQNNNFFQYSPETEAFNYAVVPKVDPNAFAKMVANQHAKDVLAVKGEKYMLGGKEKLRTETAYGLVETAKEADEIFQNRVKANKGNINGVTRPYSMEEASVAYFNQPGAAQQYLDMNPGVTPENMTQHYKDNYFDPSRKNTTGTKTEGSGLTINQSVSTGGKEENPIYFDYDETPNTYKAVGKDITSIGKMPLSKNNIPYEGTISKQMFNPITGKPASGDLKNSKLVIGELITLPIETNADGSIKLIDGKINLLEDTTLKQFKAIVEKRKKNITLTAEEEKYKNKYFKFKAMTVLRNKNNLGAPELLDDDLITEFKNIKSTFEMNIPQPNNKINSREEFKKNYLIMQNSINKAQQPYMITK